MSMRDSLAQLQLYKLQQVATSLKRSLLRSNAQSRPDLVLVNPQQSSHLPQERLLSSNSVVVKSLSKRKQMRSEGLKKMLTDSNAKTG